MELSCQIEMFFNTAKFCFELRRNILLGGEHLCSDFLRTANYYGPFLRGIHSANCLFTARL